MDGTSGREGTCHRSRGEVRTVQSGGGGGGGEAFQNKLNDGKYLSIIGNKEPLKFWRDVGGTCCGL